MLPSRHEPLTLAQNRMAISCEFDCPWLVRTIISMCTPERKCAFEVDPKHSKSDCNKEAGCMKAAELGPKVRSHHCSATPCRRRQLQVHLTERTPSSIM